VEVETPVALRAPSVSTSTGNPEFLGRTDQQEVFEKPEASILEQGAFQKTGLGVGQMKISKWAKSS
jgi:hypothetical protein